MTSDSLYIVVEALGSYWLVVRAKLTLHVIYLMHQRSV